MDSSRPATTRRYEAYTALLAVVVYLGWIQLEVGGPFVSLAVDDFGQFVAAAWAGWACLRRAQASAPGRARPWRALAVGCAFWAAGELVWSWLEVVQRVEVPFPSLADIGFLAFVPFAAVGLAGFIRSPSGALAKVRAVSDAGLVGGSVFYASWVLVLDPLFEGIRVGANADTLALLYPITDVLLAVLALSAISRSRRRSRWLVLVSVGALALAVSDSAFAYLNELGSYGATQAVDAGWLLGFVLIGLGARTRGAIGEPVGDDDDGATRRPVVLFTLPYMLLLGAALLGVLHPERGLLDPDAAMVFIAMLGLFVVNAVVVAWEHRSLTTHLEDRVRMRTEQVVDGERRFRHLVQDLTEVVLVFDAHLVVQSASESAVRVLGQSPDELRGLPITALAAPAERERLLVALAMGQELQSVSDSIAVKFEMAALSAGEERWAEATVRNLVDEPAVAGYVMNLRDVTERRRLEDELRSNALRDSLTGLPNRTLFLERLDHALARCRREGESLSVGMIDLDGFKTVNDSLGHHAGDELLRLVASRLDPTLRANDTVARLGGDEFAILIESAQGSELVAARVLERLREPFDLDGREVYVSASIGMTLGDGAADREELLRQADTAMYEAKRCGRNRVAAYEPHMHQAAVARLEMGAELNRALERGELHLVYQPQVEVDSGVVEGFEALLRWAHPTRGLVGPDVFIPLAEETGAIVPIGMWVLQEACRQAVEWTEPGTIGVTMSVNVSTVQMRSPSFVDDVMSALQESGLAPQSLVLELTESVLLDDGPGVVDVIQALRMCGIRIAIDDFGTGYSSLAYLQRLPIDILKVDKSFVDALGLDSNAEAVVRTIVSLAETMSAEIVAEGVEREDQRLSLISLGCHVAQGYLFARPLDVAAASKLLRSGAVVTVPETV